jgi:hypothetical protein
MHEAKGERLVTEMLSIERARELAAGLSGVLSGELSLKLLHDWIGGDADRGLFLAGMVWGTIRWNKLLGRPDGPTLASGFEIKHYAYREGFVGTATGIQEWDAWVDEQDVASYDLPETDPNYFRVGFACPGQGFAGAGNSAFTGDNRVTVQFASDRRWILSVETSVQGVPVQPTIHPPEVGFKFDKGPIVLDEFVVE